MLRVLKKDKYEATPKSWNQDWLELNGSSGPIQLTVKGVESHSGDAMYTGCHGSSEAQRAPELKSFPAFRDGGSRLLSDPVGIAAPCLIAWAPSCLPFPHSLCSALLGWGRILGLGTSSLCGESAVNP